MPSMHAASKAGGGHHNAHLTLTLANKQKRKIPLLSLIRKDKGCRVTMDPKNKGCRVTMDPKDKGCRVSYPEG